jgi:hypothetical protein
MKALEFHKTVILQDIDDTKAHAARLTASTQKLAVAHIAAIETDAKVAVDSKFNAGQMLNDILADIGKR